MENIYLCGFMGTGKTAVGVSLSKKLGVDYYDTDKIIVREQGKSIPDIFAESGEEFFRNLETQIAQKTVGFEKAIISTGGGLATIQASVDALKQGGKLVYLNTPFEVCYRRIAGDKNRPVATTKSKAELLKLYNTRHEIYKNACDVEIICEGIVSKIADDIIEYFNQEALG